MSEPSRAMSVDDFPTLSPWVRPRPATELGRMTMPWHRLADPQRTVTSRGLIAARCGTTWSRQADLEGAHDERPPGGQPACILCNAA